MAFEELQRRSEAVEIPIPAQRPSYVKWIEMEIRYTDSDGTELPVDIFFVKPQAETELRVMFQPWVQAVKWEFRYRLHFQTPSAFSDPVTGDLA